jgi:sugar phosphate isomerase/epimerase
MQLRLATAAGGGDILEHMAFSRRALLAGAAAALPLAAKTLRTIGVQLYTVRNIIDADPMKVLSELSDIGYREAEVVSGNMEKIWPALLKTRLKPVSVHLPTPYFTREQEKLGPALDDAKKRGFQYVVCPYIDPKDRGGADVIRRLAATLNKAGATCRSAGLTLCYHNHAFEFEFAGEGTLLDLLMKETDPKHVALELDMFWASVAGFDPAKVLAQYSGRVPLLHVKDKAAGTEKRLDEKVPRVAFKEVGSGVIDIKGVLQAAEKAGVRHYFVEQDQTAGDPIGSLRTSYAYLRDLKF